MKEQALGFNLIGPASVNAGLGVIMREYAKALLAAGITVAIFDNYRVGARSGHDLTLQKYFVDELDKLPHEINIWVIGGLTIMDSGLAICASPHLQSKFNVAFIWWETANIPPRWAVGAQAFDAIIAASEFVCETWANSVSGVPVILAPVPLSMPLEIGPDRIRFGLPVDPLLIYTGFEPASDPVRKNPFAGIEAFRRAFPENNDVRLVIKINNPSVEGKLHDGMARMYAMLEGDKRVILLTDSMSYKDTLSLYASCDIIMSLHRAEGLGLMPLEAMRLGKPVIATGWSGNMTYMNHCSAALIRYELVAPDESATHYSLSALGVKTRWAEPSIEHAVNWLQALVENKSLREDIGDHARMHTAAYDLVARQLNFVKELAALLRNKYLQPAKNFTLLNSRIKKADRQPIFTHNGRIRVDLVRRRLRVAFDRHVSWRF